MTLQCGRCLFVCLFSLNKGVSKYVKKWARGRAKVCFIYFFVWQGFVFECDFMCISYIARGSLSWVYNFVERTSLQSA
jgi:hypothetical protein